MLTGRRPDTTRIFNNTDTSYWYVGDCMVGMLLIVVRRERAGNFTPIPEYFKQHGYFTQGIGKIFHGGPASGQDDICCSW